MKFRERIKYICLKFVKTDDTPHRIALGFAIGIFYGLVPFIGVIPTLITAAIFRANKASALAGCFVTNTWVITAVLVLPSVKVGSKIFGLDWTVVWQEVKRYLSMSDIKDIFNALSRDVLVPSLIGFLVIALCMSAASYAISLYLVLKYKKRKN